MNHPVNGLAGDGSGHGLAKVMFNFLQMVNHQTRRAAPRAHPRIAPK
jgi:hypothetical protein